MEHRALALGGGAEFDAIRAMVERWGKRAIDIGDDGAVLRVPRGDALIASVDAAIEGQHFRPEWLTPREIGYRATTAALSDLAAMAASPLGVLLAIALPERWRDRLLELADGVGEALEAGATPILGGNLVAAGELSLTTTVLGAAFAPLRRGGLRPGDRLYVTGRLGGPASAVRAWKRGEEPLAECRQRFAHPSARLHEARWLSDRGAIAAIDISDGLAADLEHLVSASGVGAEVQLSNVPLIAGVDDPIFAAASGEEFELLVGAREPIDAAEFERAFGLPLTNIGRVTSAGGELVFRLGDQRVAKPKGYDHLSQ